mmetsp:Transcript_9047/g.8043  ORF Transcript_9047/g.8043 Transcript_9047/m.8043 type:complete len:128 (+) Transcript_9047:1022-1405(+)
MNAYKNTMKINKFIQFNHLKLKKKKNILSNVNINKALKKNRKEVNLVNYPSYSKNKRSYNNSKVNGINTIFSHRRLACALKSQDDRPQKQYCNFMENNPTLMIHKKNIHSGVKKNKNVKTKHLKQQS